jgi:hypothetical protein
LTDGPVSVNLPVNLEIKGEVPPDALGRAVHALTDAVSPFTEGLGLIGDHIRAHRYDVAIKIAYRAREIANIQARRITPPPLKFTVPFLEKSSTETDDDEMCELWARLLVDACDDYQGVHLTYIQILSEISGSEARYLDSLGRRHSVDRDLPPPRQIATKYTEELSEHLSVLRGSPPFNTSLLQTENAELAIDAVYGLHCTEICRPTTVAVPVSAAGETITSSYRARGDRATTAYLLQRQGLVAIETERSLPSLESLKLSLRVLRR